MTLIKCPNCGKTILSVASTCPGCNASLTHELLPLSTGGSLLECRRCGRPTLSGARVCANCGVRFPGRNPAVPALVVGFTVLFVGTVMLTLVIQAVDGVMERVPTAKPIAAAPPPRARRPDPAPTLAQAPPPAETPRPAQAAPDTTPPAVAEPSPPVTAAPRETTIIEADSAPAAAKPTAPKAPVLTPQTRWATNLWVNVRAEPANESAVVGVLRPGQRVEAGAPTWDGWQLVYVEGKRMGYVARALLVTRAPG